MPVARPPPRAPGAATDGSARRSRCSKQDTSGTDRGAAMTLEHGRRCLLLLHRVRPSRPHRSPGAEGDSAAEHSGARTGDPEPKQTANTQITRRLYISVSTVRSHLDQIPGQDRLPPPRRPDQAGPPPPACVTEAPGVGRRRPKRRMPGTLAGQRPPPCAAKSVWVILPNPRPGREEGQSGPCPAPGRHGRPVDQQPERLRPNGQEHPMGRDPRPPQHPGTGSDRSGRPSQHRACAPYPGRRSPATAVLPAGAHRHARGRSSRGARLCRSAHRRSAAVRPHPAAASAAAATNYGETHSPGYRPGLTRRTHPDSIRGAAGVVEGGGLLLRQQRDLKLRARRCAPPPA